MRRKTIRNSIKPVVNELALGAKVGEVFEKLEHTGLLEYRPEKLGVEDFITLAKCFK